MKYLLDSQPYLDTVLGRFYFSLDISVVNESGRKSRGEYIFTVLGLAGGNPADIMLRWD